MGSANFAYSRKSAALLGNAQVSGAYTIKTGRTADGQVIDSSVEIVDPAADFAMTLPDGTYIGQTVLVTFTSDANTKDCTLTVTHHQAVDAGSEPLDAVDEHMLFMWKGTEWVTLDYSTAGDIA